MNILANLLNTEIASILKDLTGFVDGLVVTKEEKAKIIERIGNADNEIQMRIQDALTERQRIDMQSDSWLSKNVRPIVLLSIVFLFLLLSFCEGVGWLTVPDGYISVLKNWGELAFMFYFGSRGIEKIVSRTPELSQKLFERKKRK